MTDEAEWIKNLKERGISARVIPQPPGFLWIGDQVDASLSFNYYFADTPLNLVGESFPQSMTFRTTVESDGQIAVPRIGVSSSVMKTQHECDRQSEASCSGAWSQHRAIAADLQANLARVQVLDPQTGGRPYPLWRIERCPKRGNLEDQCKYCGCR